MLLGIAPSVFMATNNIHTTIFHRDQSHTASKRCEWELVNEYLGVH